MLATLVLATSAADMANYTLDDWEEGCEYVNMMHLECRDQCILAC